MAKSCKNQTAIRYAVILKIEPDHTHPFLLGFLRLENERYVVCERRWVRPEKGGDTAYFGAAIVDDPKKCFPVSVYCCPQRDRVSMKISDCTGIEVDGV